MRSLIGNTGVVFLTCIIDLQKCEKTTILIIMDNEGYIFGGVTTAYKEGYASQPWERHAECYGDMKSLLFHLYPTTSIY